MPTSLVGLLVVALAVLPGSTYTWAFERHVSAFGVTLADSMSLANRIVLRGAW